MTEVEIYEALRAVCVPADKARAVAASNKREINDQFTLHASQFATRADLEAAMAWISNATAAVKTDVAELESRLQRTLNENMR